jgi:exodeoxyribonuclease VII large subunit
MERSLHSYGPHSMPSTARLHALSPLAVLDRGYALVLAADGSVVRSIAQLTQGEALTTRLADGTFNSQVKAISAKNDTAK